MTQAEKDHMADHCGAIELLTDLVKALYVRVEGLEKQVERGQRIRSSNHEALSARIKALEEAARPKDEATKEAGDDDRVISHEELRDWIYKGVGTVVPGLEPAGGPGYTGVTILPVSAERVAYLIRRSREVKAKQDAPKTVAEAKEVVKKSEFDRMAGYLGLGHWRCVNPSDNYLWERTDGLRVSFLNNAELGHTLEGTWPELLELYDREKPMMAMPVRGTGEKPVEREAKATKTMYTDHFSGKPIPPGASGYVIDPWSENPCSIYRNREEYESAIQAAGKVVSETRGDITVTGGPGGPSIVAKLPSVYELLRESLGLPKPVDPLPADYPKTVYAASPFADAVASKVDNMPPPVPVVPASPPVPDPYKVADCVGRFGGHHFVFKTKHGSDGTLVCDRCGMERNGTKAK